jgi:hypothetical protein
MAECPFNYYCVKCKASSGDDWSQCKGACPVPKSPHYSAETAAKWPDVKNGLRRERKS